MHREYNSLFGYQFVAQHACDVFGLHAVPSQQWERCVWPSQKQDIASCDLCLATIRNRACALAGSSWRLGITERQTSNRHSTREKMLKNWCANAHAVWLWQVGPNEYTVFTQGKLPIAKTRLARSNSPLQIVPDNSCAPWSKLRNFTYGVYRGCNYNEAADRGTGYRKLWEVDTCQLQALENGQLLPINTCRHMRYIALHLKSGASWCLQWFTEGAPLCTQLDA